MEVSISRRSLAIGGPAALAASSLAPLGVLGTLAGVHTQAAAAPVLTENGFDAYYKNTFHDRAVNLATFRLAVIIARDEAVTRNITYSGTRTAQIQAQLSSPAQIESYLTANNYNLSIAGPAFPGVTRWDWICINLRTDISNDAILKVDFGAYLNWITTTLTDDELNELIQHRMRLWHHMERFLYMCLTKAAYTTFMQRIASIEAKDDRRYLAGTIDDGLYDELNSVGVPTGNLRMRWGNSRPLLERVELINLNLWWKNLFSYATYGETNEIQHGINSTGTELVDNINLYTNTTAYPLGQDQISGLEHYINRDVELLGPYAGMDKPQSKRFLRALATNAYRVTGNVYLSYEAGSIYLRALAQAIIAITRFRLDNKSINLGYILTKASDLAMFTPAARYATTRSRYEIGAVCVLLSGIVAGTVAANALTLASAQEAVDEGKKIGATELQMLETAKSKVMIRMSSIVNGAQLLSVGILGYVSLPREQPANVLARWLTPGFALSDFTSGLKTWIAIRRKVGPYTTADYLNISGATLQVCGSLVGTVESMWKLYTHDYAYTNTVLGTVPALRINSLTAGTAATLYGLAGTILYFGL